MRKYQIVIKPTATATGEPGHWSFYNLGQPLNAIEAREVCKRIDARGSYVTKRLAI